MKKVSAFSVFNNPKKKKEVTSRPPHGQEVTMRRAPSSQSVDSSGSRGKRLLSALKNGNIRESIRLSGKKSRPTSLIDASSPFSEFDKISLGKRNSKADKAIRDSPATPLTRKKSPKLGTPKLGRKSAKTSTTSLQQAMESTEDRKGKRVKKRKSLEVAPQGSGKKRMKTEKGASEPNERWRRRRLEFPYMYDSVQEASKLFECIIHPVKTERFFSELWEKKPLLVKRHTPDYNKGWFTTADFDKILRQEHIEWDVNLDATSFVDDKRETHNQSGRAHAPVVWDMYQAGCSLRLLNPQTYSRSVWKVLSVLQEYFGCCVGANVYLTPPGTQGFAPHYDDIEAFIIQLEGKKHWRLYSPRTDDEVLPQYSSSNLSQSELGEPVLDVELEAGDLLYFPRGTIHQGMATEEHSLHVTVSCYQMNTWGDLLRKLLPTALEVAIEESVELRKGLPRDYLNYMGLVHAEKDLPERKEFSTKVKALLHSMIDSLPLDSACDQMGKQFMLDTMPPVLSDGERSCSVHGAGERWDPDLNRVMGVSELSPSTQVKLIRKGAVRLLMEEDKVRVYHNVENCRVYRKAGPKYLEISPDLAPAVECLINAYPEFMAVDNLPLENVSDQINIVSMLYEKGVLLTSDPLEPTYDEPGQDTEEDDS